MGLIDMRYRPTFFVLAAAFATTVMMPARGAEPRAVIELFTSQGCSSCPPADRLLGKLSQDPSLIALSLPVDYWDYLGWKDTLALHGDSERQRDYSLVRGDRAVYTPQVVVNGMKHVLGSNEEAIDEAIGETRRNADALSVPVNLRIADGAITVEVSAAAGDKQSGEVWLCPVTGKAPVKIGRGENRDHTIVYHNVVRRWVKLGEWNGKAQRFDVKLADLPNAKFTLADIDHAAVLLQSGTARKPGMILGAAMTTIPAAAVR